MQSKLQTERPDRTPLCLQYAMETGARRNGRYHAFRFTINATDCVLVAEEDHRRGPYVMLSEQTRHRFHSCRAIVGKEETPPLIQCPNCSHTTTGRMLQAGTLSYIKAQIFYPSLDSFCRSTGGKRWPSSQVPVPAASASSLPLSPKSELEEVQKGITVFPVKSLASTKPSTSHAAIPHQMG